MRIIQTEACVHVPNVKFKLVLCQNDTKASFKRPTQALNVRAEGAPLYTQTKFKYPLALQGKHWFGNSC